GPRRLRRQPARPRLRPGRRDQGPVAPSDPRAGRVVAADADLDPRRADLGLVPAQPVGPGAAGGLAAGSPL
ncbi:MAG: hypothetical protein AVDCRST_MAG73-1790, partial [uncultured Thermomicrobiales bacterium]